MRTLGLVLAVVAAGCLGGPVGLTPSPPSTNSTAHGNATLDPSFATEKLLGGLATPVHLAHAGDGSGRLFVVEQDGRIRVVRDGALLGEPFLDLRDRVGSGGERGLLSVAFDPAFETNGRFFVYYTDREGDVVLARYRAASGSDRADAASGVVLLTIDHGIFPNHNGGALAFGPDGHLYAGVGDGGGAGDPGLNGQDVDELLGKILRLDVRGETYAAPSDNPFVGRDGRDEIWALGLRNPWRLSFDRAEGHLYVADVGQGTREEIDFAPRDSAGGVNYGWNVWEGTHRYRPGDTRGTATFPVAEYENEGDHCAVTGGHVYRGARAPSLVGVYLYADYCSGVVWGLWSEGGRWVTRQLADTDLRISSFGEDEAGDVYVVDHGGDVHRVVDG